MNIEEQLKEYILTKHKSVLEFTQEIEMPYSTFRTILKRGIENANVLNIIKICQALNISTDSLAAGKIVPLPNQSKLVCSVEAILDNAKNQMLTADEITLNGQLLNQAQIKSIVNSIDLLVEIEKKNKHFH